MSFRDLLSDRCTIQNRGINTAGKVDTETWTSQAAPTPCRALVTINRRRTSPDSAEKVQYGTFVFVSFTLPKTAVIANHDRILWQGRVYDVIGLVTARNGRGPRHLVANCDARA